jgi:hypothetical protein
VLFFFGHSALFCVQHGVQAGPGPDVAFCLSC